MRPIDADKINVEDARGNVRELIDRQPTIDMEPVRYGKWIRLERPKGMERYRCSECNEIVRVPECMGEPIYKRCPWCGAKMDKG